VTFKADTATAKVDALTADKTEATDDGKDAITFTAVVKDAAGAVVPNVEVTLTTTGGALSEKTVTTDDKGVVKVTLTDTAVEAVTVTATTPFDTKGKTASVTFK
ncbi:Ig-like domain-containing protein, partial [Hafnia paralvei]|uniref:Ig-like domain-containing protein n=1 Tax=Hafnia paralvei TaxID=546367 RepID=UPI0010D822E7